MYLIIDLVLNFDQINEIVDPTFLREGNRYVSTELRILRRFLAKRKISGKLNWHH